MMPRTQTAAVLTGFASLAAIMLLTTALSAGAQTLGSPGLGGSGGGLGAGLGAGLSPGGALGGGSTEVRLDRLERMLNEQTLSDLVLQIQRLQQEVQDLRGQVELQQYRMQQMDRGGFAGFGAGPVRPPLPANEADALTPGDSGSADGAASGGTGAPVGQATVEAGDNGDGGIDALGPVVAPPPQQGLGALGRGDGGGGTLALPSPETSAGGEREAYRAAFELLKDRDYPRAKQAFTSMLARYPQGQFADNGLYWLGEIGYVTKDYPAAMIHFNRLISDYPLSPKLPGAMLKLGYVYYDQNDLEQARNVLMSVAERFPDTTEGRLAKGRLDQMTRGGS